MTVCIAALCDNRNMIVTVSDSKASYGDYSADDVLLKNERLSENWNVLFSGSDITEVGFILRRAKENVLACSDQTPEAISLAVQEACVDRFRGQVEAKVLTRYGFTFDEFRDTGRDKLTESVYEKIFSAAAAIKLSTQFIVTGFDGDGVGHILTVDSESAPDDFGSVGFCAIGSGLAAATNALLYYADRYSFSSYSPLDESIFCCCAAKFMAESASDVGRATFLAVFEHGKKPAFVSRIRIDEDIRRAWERIGAPRMPKAIIKAIPDMLYRWDDPAGSMSDRFFGNDARRKRSDSYLREYRALRRSIEITGQEEKPNPQSTKDDLTPP